MGNCMNPRLGHSDTSRLTTLQPHIDFKKSSVDTLNETVSAFLASPIQNRFVSEASCKTLFTLENISSRELGRRISSVYSFSSQESAKRQVDKVVEVIMESPSVEWNHEVSQLPLQEGREEALLQLNQTFKWLCTSLFICIAKPDKLELFWQEFTLKHGLREFLETKFKISETFDFNKEKVRPLKASLLLDYSGEELARGVWVKNVCVRRLSSVEYLLMKRELLDRKGTDVTTFIKYRHHIYLFSPTETQIKHLKQPENESVALWIPQNQKQTITNIRQGQNYFDSVSGEQLLSKSERLHHGQYEVLCLSLKDGLVNKRATFVLSLFGKTAETKGDAYIILKKRHNNIDFESSFKEVPDSMIETFYELKNFCSKHKVTPSHLLKCLNTAPEKLYRLILCSILTTTIRLLPHQSISQCLRALFSPKICFLKQQLYLLLSVQLLFVQPALLVMCHLILNTPKTYPLQFLECVYMEYGVYLDELALRVKQDSSYLSEHSEIEEQSIRYAAVIQNMVDSRSCIYFFVSNYKGELLRVQHKEVRIKTPAGMAALPSLKGLEEWCKTTQNMHFRGPTGTQHLLVDPLMIKYAIEVLLNLDSKEETQKRIQSTLDNMVICPGEVYATFYSLKGMAMQVKDNTFSEQMYIQTLGILHRLHCDPRSRGNLASPWQAFILARMINMKKILKKEVEVEWLQGMMDCLTGKEVAETSPRSMREFPFPTGRNGTERYQIHDMVSWIMQNLPIMQPSQVLFRKKEFQKLQDLNRSVTSTDSRSSASRRQKFVFDLIEKNEATLSKAKYQGVFVLGNSKQCLSIYTPLKNLIVTRISCGLSHVTLSTQDSIYGWGDNTSSQLGEPHNTSFRKMYYEPATKLSCGSECSGAIINRKLKMWGQRAGGIVAGDGYVFDDIECGGLHSVGVRDGEVYSWGRGEGGQLGISLEELEVKKGDESSEYYLSKPKRIKGLERVTKVACGDAHTLVLTKEGRVFVFGFSYQGQLGLGLTGESSQFQIFEPVALEFFKDTRIQSISAGSTFSVFLTQNQQVWACGLNDYHQLGLEQAMRIEPPSSNSFPNLRPRRHSGSVSYSIPTRIDFFNDFEVSGIYCGENHSLAKCNYSGQELYIGWGMNKSHQLGTPSGASTSPVTIPALERVNVREICCGSAITVVLAGPERSKKSVKEACEELRGQLGSRWGICTL